MLRKLLIFVTVATSWSAIATVASATPEGGSNLAQARSASAKYRDLRVAEAAGYGLLLDANGVACIDMPGMGAMGVHYVNGTLVGDASVDPTTPEALVYEPLDGGHLRLVALEYVVFEAAWDAHHTTPPSLFGQEFNFTPSPNRFGLPPFYSLHAWIWKHNPAGTFAMWNPKVSCSRSQSTVDHR